MSACPPRPVLSKSSGLNSAWLSCPPPPPSSELETRIEKLRVRMEQLGLTHTVVYGDREHFANLTYLTGFDPRFEESLLIVGRNDDAADPGGERVRGVSGHQLAP